MSYLALVAHHQRLSQLRHVEAIASWDESTMMPTGGSAARSEALSTLRGVIHQQATDARLVDLFGEADKEAANLLPWQQANLREMKREYRRSSALPRRLVEAMSRAESQSEEAWRQMRPTNDFAGFLPFFGEVVRRKREAAQALAEQLSLSPYDALIDGFDPGARVDLIAPLFARLRSVLPGLIAQTVEQQKGEEVAVCKGPFPIERQHWLALELMRRLGFDFNHGRADTGHHPLCCGVPEDMRIVLRYDVHDYSKSFLAVIHEFGHATYEQNLPREWRGQPVGAARGTATHESQSLLFEMHLARSTAFLEFLSPIIATAFPELVVAAPQAFTTKALLLQLTRVAPNLIRVDADEMTYPCHVTLRFELEQRLIEGTLQPQDLPEAWDVGMRELLGLSTRGNDRDGCMQDIHWPAGMFGYFPSYTLGALAAAQLFRAAKQGCPGLMDQIRRGELGQLYTWLRQNIWSQGSFQFTAELVKQATGQPLSTAAFEEHLETVYVQRQA